MHINFLFKIFKKITLNMANRTSKIERLLSIRYMHVEQVIAILRAKNLLRRSQRCRICDEPMAERRRDNTHVDLLAWQCTKHKSTVSIREGSFFDGFRISLADVWTLILMWSENIQVGDAAHRYGMCRRTVQSIYEKLQSLAVSYLQTDPIRLGGPSIVCQIDESLFCHKQKNNRGRQAVSERWVFGIADVSYSPARFYMEVVDDRSAETLLPIIERVCRPGSIIYSDSWSAYRRIQERIGFEHFRVNHSVNFVDPETGVHTQNIESRWAQEKAKINRMKGIRAEKLSKFLAEIVWKDNARDNIILYILELIKANEQ